MSTNAIIRPRVTIVVADSNGNVADCGQGGGVGFMVEKSSTKLDGSTPSATGQFPVTVFFDGQPNGDSIIINGAAPLYVGDVGRFDRLSLQGGTPGGAYRVTIFRDISHAIGTAPVAMLDQEELLLSYAYQGIAPQPTPLGGGNKLYLNSDTGASFTQGKPWDVRRFAGALLRITPIGTPQQATAFLEGWTTSAGQGNYTLPNGNAAAPQQKAQSAGQVVGNSGGAADIFFHPRSGTGGGSQDGNSNNSVFKPMWVRPRLESVSFSSSATTGFLMELYGLNY